MTPSIDEDFVLTGVSAYDAARYALWAPSMRDRAAQFIDADAELIDVESLVEAPWSSGEAVLVGLAADLVGTPGHVRVRDLATSLDDANFARALTAMWIARSWRRSAALPPGGGGA